MAFRRVESEEMGASAYNREDWTSVFKEAKVFFLWDCGAKG
jgi:hypothetical protein